jgi:hypothetical protein
MYAFPSRFLQLEQSENRWQLVEEKQRELCEKEKKTAVCYFNFLIFSVYEQDLRKERFF